MVHNTKICNIKVIKITVGSKEKKIRKYHDDKK
jgi:hypothetical protein